MNIPYRIGQLEVGVAGFQQRVEKSNSCHVPSGPNGGQFCSGGGGGGGGSHPSDSWDWLTFTNAMKSKEPFLKGEWKQDPSRKGQYNAQTEKFDYTVSIRSSITNDVGRDKLRFAPGTASKTEVVITQAKRGEGYQFKAPVTLYSKTVKGEGAAAEAKFRANKEKAQALVAAKFGIQ